MHTSFAPSVRQKGARLAVTEQWQVCSWGTPQAAPADPAAVEVPAAIEVLVARGSEVNAVGMGGWTALAMASSGGHAAAIEALVAARAATANCSSVGARRRSVRRDAMGGRVATEFWSHETANS